MDNLSNRKDLKLHEGGSNRPAIQELSEREIGNVAGGGCAWFEWGQGTIFHGGYPAET